MFAIFHKKNTNKSTPSPETKSVTLELDGLHCTSCSLNIDGALEDIPGVISATTSYAKSQTVVVFLPKQVSVKLLESIITELGYRVVK